MIGISPIGSYFPSGYQVKPIKSSLPSYGQQSYNKLNALREKQKTNYAAYMQQLESYNKTSKSFYAGLYENMSALKSSAAQLKNFSGSSLLNPMGYGSSNTAVASLSPSSTPYTGRDMQLSVQQVATTQKTTSATFESTAKDALRGNGSITINTGGRSTTLNFQVAENTTNRDALTQLAGQINSANLGITASVTEKDGQSSLVIESKNTGEAAAFTATTAGSAGNLSLTNTQTAKDAVYKLDTTSYTSASNTVSLGQSGLQATLKAAGETTIGQNRPDAQAVVKAVKTFAQDYNKTLSFLNSNSSLSRPVSDLAYSFSTSRFSAGSLSDIGILVDSAGRLSVNEGKLTTALQQDPSKVRSVLGGRGGLAEQAYTTATNNLTPSQNLLPPPKISNENFSAYLYTKNLGVITPQNPVYGTGAVINLFA